MAGSIITAMDFINLCHIKNEPIDSENGFDKLSQNSVDFTSLGDCGTTLATSKRNEDLCHIPDLQFDPEFRSKIKNLDRFLIKIDLGNETLINGSQTIGKENILHSQNNFSSYNGKSVDNTQPMANFENQFGSFKEYQGKDPTNVCKNSSSLAHISCLSNHLTGIDDFDENSSESLFMKCIQASSLDSNKSLINRNMDPVTEVRLNQDSKFSFLDRDLELNSSSQNLFLLASQEMEQSNFRFDQQASKKPPNFGNIQNEVELKNLNSSQKENIRPKTTKSVNSTFKPFKPVFKKPFKSLSQTGTQKSSSVSYGDNFTSTSFASQIANELSVSCDKENTKVTEKNDSHYLLDISNTCDLEKNLTVMDNALEDLPKYGIKNCKIKKHNPLHKISVKKMPMKNIDDENNNIVELADLNDKPMEEQNFPICENSLLAPLNNFAEIFDQENELCSPTKDHLPSSLSNNSASDIYNLQGVESFNEIESKKLTLKNSVAKVKENANFPVPEVRETLISVQKGKIIKNSKSSKKKVDSLTKDKANCAKKFCEYNNTLQKCIELFRNRYPHLYSKNSHKNKSSSKKENCKLESCKNLSKSKSKIAVQFSKKVSHSLESKVPIPLDSMTDKKKVKSKLKSKAVVAKNLDKHFVKSKLSHHADDANLNNIVKGLTKHSPMDFAFHIDNEKIKNEVETTLDQDVVQGKSLDISMPEAFTIDDFDSSNKFESTSKDLHYPSSILMSTTCKNSVDSEVQQLNNEEIDKVQFHTNSTSRQSSPVLLKNLSLKTKKQARGKGLVKPSLRNFLRNEKIAFKSKGKKLNSTRKQISSLKQHLYELQKKTHFPVWVMCDECKKWRCLRDTLDPAVLPQRWICSLNNDSQFRNCSVPEVRYDQEEHERIFTFSKFTLGSVVWITSECWGLHWWPAMVDDDPDTDTYFWLPSNSSEPNFYHVTFFGHKASRAWIKSQDVKPFVLENIPLKFKKIKKSRDLETAIEQANEAVNMQLDERRQMFCFATRYQGSWFTQNTTDD